MKPTKPFTIIRDTREQTKGNGYLFLPNGDECSGQVVETLKTGDYSIKGLEHILRIERKASVSEFAKNITEARFWREMVRMEEFPLRFLLLEFSVNNVSSWPIGSTVPRKKWGQIRTTPQFIFSKIGDIQVKHGIDVIFAGDRDNGQLLAYNILKKTYEQYYEE